MEQVYALDQFLSLTIAPDKSAAYLEFSKHEEGFYCSLQDLEQYLEKHHICYGIKRQTLQQLADRPESFFLVKTLIAEGIVPVSGKDGYIRMAEIMNKSDEHRPLETQDGKVDYKELTRLSNVRKGQLIAERMDPEPGVPGTGVTGEEIPFREGREARFKVGKNVVVHPEGSALYAAIDGMVTMTDQDKINVFPVYEINGDVDYSIGNINFVGTVVIRGNVLTGFRVKADGDIRVVGGVEGAELEAAGSIEITEGIIGYHKGLVKAGYNVKCSFIQDGNVTAGADIIVSQSIMHSNLRAGKQVLCSGAKGLIVGGSIQAGEKVEARTIGNTMSTVTSIEVGVLPELRNELADLRNLLKEQTVSLDKTSKALNILDQLAAAGQLTPDKVTMRMKLKATKVSTEQEKSENRERMLEIERMLEDTDTARVEVRNMIYSGSKIVIGRYTKYIKDPVQRMVFHHHDGDIGMSTLV
ncbi:FapA family protein [Paenibacillus sp. P96]|uniref:FapA family protein n=1 Tax=Paenibacillus zeirhizosphaerae TaxID=2987519 RepID=A0ABT9FS21_9BACL|nr:FapA family protein [Paenibacillus sp. P96]MDP4097516.1 FapA family protein [Paenibacillus sp. P96]